MRTIRDPHSHVRLRYVKWPHELHYVVPTRVLADSADGTWVGVAKGTTIDRGSKGSLVARSRVVVFIPSDEPWVARWYDHRDHGERGRVSSYRMYVDITTVAEHTQNEIMLVDLDFDVAVTWDGEVLLLDEQEFVNNAVARNYPEDLSSLAREAAQEVFDRVTRSLEPFDSTSANRFLLSLW